MSNLARLTCRLVVAAVSLRGTPAPAAPPSDAELAKGIALARAGDFQGALLKLDETVRRLEAAGAPDPELAQGYLYLAISYLELGQELPAVERFRAAVLRDPALRLDPGEFSPQVIRYFDAARQEVAAMRAPGSRPPAVRPPAPTPEKKGHTKTVLLVVATGAAIATAVALAAGGEDRQTTTTAAPPRAPLSGTGSGWTSVLEAPGARGQMLLDGETVPASGPFAASTASTSGRHHLEAVLVAGTGRAGTWRFHLPGIRAGSLRVAAGAGAPGRDTIVFRLEGHPGERIAFTFETEP
jgi:hypothetical protein